MAGMRVYEQKAKGKRTRRLLDKKGGKTYELRSGLILNQHLTKKRPARASCTSRPLAAPEVSLSMHGMA